MGMTPECVAPTGCVLGESPVWSVTENRLWWVDVKRAKLHRYNPLTGNTRRYDLPIKASALALHAGLMLMAGEHELGLYDPVTEDYRRLAGIAGLAAGTRTSDGGVAPDGSFWFGTTDDAEREPVGGYFRFGADNTVSALRLPSAMSTNTFQFSPDGATFYTCDTVEREILAFDHDRATGNLTGRRVLASTHELGGFPRGSAVDAHGRLWTALWGAARVVCHTPAGEVAEVITLAAPLPTSCAFGGADMRTLFITTARVGLSFMQLDARPLSGSLFAIDLDVPGLHPRSYGAAA
jgi:xylono-1,5-lactonase